jgi:hypothetical protein
MLLIKVAARYKYSMYSMHSMYRNTENDTIVCIHVYHDHVCVCVYKVVTVSYTAARGWAFNSTNREVSSDPLDSEETQFQLLQGTLDAVPAVALAVAVDVPLARCCCCCCRRRRRRRRYC